MKKYFLMALLLGPLAATSQINPEDGSVQIIGYWDKGEKHTYDFTSEKSSIKGKDTVVTESINYKVDIAILDSTATSYTVQWKYHDIDAVTENKTAQKMALFNEGLVLKFKTDEMGAFSELLNWEEIKKHNEQVVKIIEKEKDVTIKQALTAVLKEKYITREAIEAHSLKELTQFYTFHGIALAKGEIIENDITEQNPITKAMMKSHMKVELYEVSVEDSDYIVKFWQEYDKSGLVPMVTEMFKEVLGKNAGKMQELLKNASVSDYHVMQLHESGWPITSYFERKIAINELHNLETRYVSFVE